MVRNNTKILAEPNDEDTVLMSENSDDLANNGLITGNNNKSIKHEDKTTNYGSIFYLINGQVQELLIQPNKKLGTDANGNLAWV